VPDLPLILTVRQVLAEMRYCWMMAMRDQAAVQAPSSASQWAAAQQEQALEMAKQQKDKLTSQLAECRAACDQLRHCGGLDADKARAQRLSSTEACKRVKGAAKMVMNQTVELLRENAHEMRQNRFSHKSRTQALEKESVVVQREKDAAMTARRELEEVRGKLEHALANREELEEQLTSLGSQLLEYENSAKGAPEIPAERDDDLVEASVIVGWTRLFGRLSLELVVLMLCCWVWVHVIGGSRATFL
jgi:predicted  nucleic acid-binding Zn-ribbon protein